MYSTKYFQASELLKTYSKCGHIYKSSINDKRYFLLCLECSEVFTTFDAFLTHSEVHDLFLESFDEDPDAKASIAKFETGFRGQNKEYELDKEKDPLDGCSFPQLQRDTIKTEGSAAVTNGEEMKIQTNVTQEYFDGANDEDDVNSDDEGSDFEPENQSDDDENYDDDNDHDGNVGDDDCHAVFNDNAENVTNYPERKGQLNLKRLTKSHAFIRTIIQIYKQQTLLWDMTNPSRNPQTKLEAYNAMRNMVYEKYQINITAKQIEQIVKRLRLRFINHYRSSNEGSKLLWFYEHLKFIEPHINVNKQKTSICQELTHEQFLTMVKLVKENECLWNENNIYHTSVVFKEETFEKMTKNFNDFCTRECFTVNEIKNIVEEFKAIAMEENRHMGKESGVMTEECQPSSRFCKELSFLMPHVGPFNCKHCSKSFSDVYGYKLHVSKHEGTKPFKCMLCQKELTHKKEFMCHLRRHTKECPFQCEFCEKSFPSKKEWQRHVIKHGSKPYVCELCADSFYTQHQLTNHMKNHANIRDHVCPQCGKGFTHRGLLRQHLQTHNKMECLCPVCNNIYANPRSLRKHYVRVHELQQEPSAAHIYSCKICLITFSTLQEAKQHRKEHKQSLPAKRHVCDICGHDFAYPRNLADHKKIHTNIRDQVCDVCGKAFTNMNLLNQHKNVHNGQKFVCKACGKDYAHYRGLCRHITKVHRSNIKELCTVVAKQAQSQNTAL